MDGFIIFLLILVLIVVAFGVRIVQQYQIGVVLRFGKLHGTRGAGFRVIIPLVDRLIKVDVRTVTLPVPPQSIITKDNVSIAVSAVAYFNVSDAVKAVINIENYVAAVNQIAQTTLRNLVGTFTLDELLASRDQINLKIKEVLDKHTERWGILVTIVEIKDIQLPESMQRAMAKQAEAEREKRAKIITAEGELLSAGKLAEAADIINQHPIALQLRNLQVLSEIAVEKNSTIIFPNQFMTTVDDVRKFIAMEKPLTK